MHSGNPILWVILAAALATAICRSIPFLLPASMMKHRTVESLGRNLPAVILFLLVFQSVRNTAASSLSFDPFAIAALAVTIALHLKWRSPLVSIAFGTALYMGLKHVDFFTSALTGVLS